MGTGSYGERPRRSPKVIVGIAAMRTKKEAA